MGKNNNKKYGLAKEREAKKFLIEVLNIKNVIRARGSFGAFDICAFSKTKCRLISIKSTKQKYCSFNREIEKIRQVKVPDYCQKELWIWWSPCKERKNKGWEYTVID